MTAGANDCCTKDDSKIGSHRARFYTAWDGKATSSVPALRSTLRLSLHRISSAVAHASPRRDQKQAPDSDEDPGAFVSERGRNRTFNLWIKSPLLCQLSYAPQGVVPSSVSIVSGQADRVRPF